eukprot:scaffold108565_cov48-Phaeocystis_antarctica.AAC.2
MSGCEMVDWMYSEDVELYRCASTAVIATSMATSADGSSLRGVVVPPGWSTAVKSAVLEADRSSTRGSGWGLSGPVSPLGASNQPELPGAP